MSNSVRLKFHLQDIAELPTLNSPNRDIMIIHQFRSLTGHLTVIMLREQRRLLFGVMRTVVNNVNML